MTEFKFLMGRICKEIKASIESMSIYPETGKQFRVQDREALLNSCLENYIEALKISLSKENQNTSAIQQHSLMQISSELGYNLASVFGSPRIQTFSVETDLKSYVLKLFSQASARQALELKKIASAHNAQAVFNNLTDFIQDLKQENCPEYNRRHFLSAEAFEEYNRCQILRLEKYLSKFMLAHSEITNYVFSRLK
jgi:hypothetical protein